MFDVIHDFMTRGFDTATEGVPSAVSTGPGPVPSMQGPGLGPASASLDGATGLGTDEVEYGAVCDGTGDAAYGVPESLARDDSAYVCEEPVCEPPLDVEPTPVYAEPDCGIDGNRTCVTDPSDVRESPPNWVETNIKDPEANARYNAELDAEYNQRTRDGLKREIKLIAADNRARASDDTGMYAEGKLKSEVDVGPCSVGYEASAKLNEDGESVGDKVYVKCEGGIAEGEVGYENPNELVGPNRPDLMYGKTQDLRDSD